MMFHLLRRFLHGRIGQCDQRPFHKVRPGIINIHAHMGHKTTCARTQDSARYLLLTIRFDKIGLVCSACSNGVLHDACSRSLDLYNTGAATRRNLTLLDISVGR